MSRSERIFDVWAEQKIEYLEKIANRLTDYLASNEYIKDCPEVTENRAADIEGPFKIPQKATTWNEIIETRTAAIQRFLELGDISSFETFDYSDILCDGGEYISLLEDCNDLIKILEHRSKSKDKIFFIINVGEWIDYVTSVMAWLDGRYSLKLEQREERLVCGEGQREAKTRRVSKLVEHLKEYDTGKDYIEIKKNTFRGLVNNTFEGRENYPRHDSVFKSYLENAEEILLKKIILIKK